MPTFTNQALLSYNGRTTASNITRGEIVEVLSATKSALNPDYNSGSVITYLINIVNTGNTAFTGLSVNDDLGAYEFTPEGSTTPITLYPLEYVNGTIRYYINGVEQPAPTVTVNNGIVISGITVPANGNTTLIYQAVVTDEAPLSDTSIITNTATVSGGGLAEPVTVTAQIEISVGPQLSIVKGLFPRTVPENGQITYTFDIQNIGNADADETSNVQITDTFDPILTNITVAYNGEILDPANYSYDETTGVFSTVPGAITVPAATFTQDPATGVWNVIPGESILEITGTI